MLGALALAACSLFANGQTVIRFTGSTAFRAVVHAALQTSGANAVWDAAPTFGYNGTSGVSGANSSEFSGTIGGTPILIKCAWAGSEGGIQTVDENGTGYAIWFIDPTNDAMPTVAGTPTALSLSPGTQNLDDSTVAANQIVARAENHIPDACFSDTYQTVSQFLTSGAVQFNGATYPALTPVTGGQIVSGGVIGVIPFEFVVSHGSTITNITTQLARTLFQNGSTIRGQFFGNSTDQTNVTIMGRDNDSGTRGNVLTETAWGLTKALIQYYPYTAGNSGANFITSVNQTIDHLSEVPAETIDGVPLALGDGGYASGGNLSKAISGNTAAVGDLITYLGASDGNNAINATASPFSNYPCTALSYNGVAPTVANIENGTYTFWGYEHMYMRSGTASSGVGTFVNGIGQVIAATPTASTTYTGQLPGNIKYTDMLCNKTVDGSTVNLN